MKERLQESVKDVELSALIFACGFCGLLLSFAAGCYGAYYGFIRTMTLDQLQLLPYGAGGAMLGCGVAAGALAATLLATRYLIKPGQARGERFLP